MTANELFPVVLAGHVAPCIECKTVTRAPVPVRWIQSTSGPGTTLYACPEHAVKLGTGPRPPEGELRAP
ncbi:hypothetical protein E6P78_30710 [Streptomyces sp. A0958]|uniref:hypothetical protein n=1 Tax=Streptomyces sp. A0958 TaxID=2563101 RepID=UPI00109E5BC4|nr:hypothetical protein [Streptomyces sp. A0958]THA58090.1 hypothetical protein E6P78_30710 [Streptomyces sp. A0958]